MAKRDSKGKFLKGTPSPNAKGRPKEIGIAAQIRKSIADKAPEIVEVLIGQALEGDVPSAQALISRIVPTLKATSEPVLFNLDTTAGVSGVGSQIVDAISKGQVPLDSGVQLLSSLASLAKLKELDELVRRVEALEHHK